MKSKGNSQQATGNTLGKILTTCGWLLAAGSFILLAGCAQQMKIRMNPQPSQDELAQEIAHVTQAAVPPPASGSVSAGSLWPADDRLSLYGDHKAFRVGDVLTVIVSESAKASNTANTDLARKSANKTTLTA